MPGSSTTEHENSLPTILRPRPRRRTRLFFEDEHEDDNEDDFHGRTAWILAPAYCSSADSLLGDMTGQGCAQSNSTRFVD